MEPSVSQLAKGLEETKQLVLQGQVALNIVWTLITGFLVMFMQAGFALVETGLTRAKNVAHTMGMNFLVYASHQYYTRDILWGARHVDIIHETPEGHLEIDVRKFHDIEPTAPTERFPYSRA